MIAHGRLAVPPIDHDIVTEAAPGSVEHPTLTLFVAVAFVETSWYRSI